MSREESRLPTIAYLSTEYPCVSHTFIRREILALEKLGYSITRIGIRPGKVLVDSQDKAERERTLYLGATEELWTILKRICHGALLARGRLISGLKQAARFSRRSERGIAKHLAYWLEALALRSILSSRDVSHVHVHFGNNAATVALLCRTMGGAPYSMTVHGPDEFDSPIGFSLGEKADSAAFVVAITNYCVAQVRRWSSPSTWNRIHIVGCTVGDEWFGLAEPIAEAARDFVCVGRLTRNKGQLLLVEAFAGALARGLNAHLILIGDGEMRDQIEARIRDLRIEEYVEITGWQSGEQIRRHMLQARAFVLPSFAEGLPVVLMESMALERPVITSLITGIPELVQDLEHGWLVIAGSTESLEDALLKAGEAPIEQLREMGHKAQNQVREGHDSDVEAGKLHRLFQEYVQ